MTNSCNTPREDDIFRHSGGSVCRHRVVITNLYICGYRGG